MDEKSSNGNSLILRILLRIRFLLKSAEPPEPGDRKARPLINDEKFNARGGIRAMWFCVVRDLIAHSWG